MEEKTVLTPSQSSARERRHAAVHEAGHVVVARHLGLRILEAGIRKNDLQELDEKEWIGSVQCQMEGVAARKRRMVAVAGVVAEACWEGEEYCHGVYEFFDTNPEKMSPSDWDFSGCLCGKPSEQLFDAMKQVFELLNSGTGGLWNALLVEARRLIVQSRLDADPSVHPMEAETSSPAP